MARKQTGFYRFIAAVLQTVMRVVTVPTWRGAEHLPAGGFLAVGNHVSNFDPLTFAHFLHGNGVPPRFLAKSSLFEVPVLGRMLRRLDQIPVYRGTAQAAEALVAAEAALAAGEGVAVFPEGTLTRDPAMWPMSGKTGVARLALRTRVPVIPVAQWGAHLVLPPYTSSFRPLPRKPVTVVAGPPVNLDDLYDRPLEQEVLQEATRRIMAAVTAQLADIRGATPPAEPYDMRRDGDPHAADDAARAARKAARVAHKARGAARNAARRQRPAAPTPSEEAR
ncbi:1-acyl-sn-glycerol-3-phosphate acyltransferase [Georgenia yuyongxinii]|uniref:1-acyl-sn-glycerol-3-phosphate acyltransferase n=1 Tax=Georgenia yuyongxinii TaxID=2589797 RepID=A0A5B8C3H8_9MICO|nr:lysophospholipid acyltransferase family protein [Georgenia yuyongxinii]QDC25299.1 1-acyl-sn-glycerol-3-phosphate acyltransferase [Georgenia yuyongxinii]